jgi:hypothetical protein
MSLLIDEPHRFPRCVSSLGLPLAADETPAEQDDEDDEDDDEEDEDDDEDDDEDGEE